MDNPASGEGQARFCSGRDQAAWPEWQQIAYFRRALSFGGHFGCSGFPPAPLT
jgi:hypothetical protein